MATEFQIVIEKYWNFLWFRPAKRLKIDTAKVVFGARNISTSIL